MAANAHGHLSWYRKMFVESAHYTGAIGDAMVDTDEAIRTNTDTHTFMEDQFLCGTGKQFANNNLIVLESA